MALLLALEAQEHSFEFVFPGKDSFDGGAARINNRIEKTWTSALGLFLVARICFDVGFHSRVENVFAIRFAIETCVEIEGSASQV